MIGPLLWLLGELAAVAWFWWLCVEFRKMRMRDREATRDLPPDWLSINVPRLHRFCMDKYIYMWLMVAGWLWVVIHFNMPNWGLPLTDDQGAPLR